MSEKPQCKPDDDPKKPTCKDDLKDWKDVYGKGWHEKYEKKCGKDNDPKDPRDPESAEQVSAELRTGPAGEEEISTSGVGGSALPITGTSLGTALLLALLAVGTGMALVLVAYRRTEVGEG